MRSSPSWRRATDVGGAIGAGGSGGTALISPALRALPVGVPKVLVSTVASGNVGPYVGPADICMMYSVTDVQGLNSISRRVLGNAAHALAGMMRHAIPPASEPARPALGLTMFGVTTPCVQMVAKALEDDYDCLVFHATGTGGQSMEKLVDSGLIAGVIDVTTTEVCDLLMGGVFSAGEDRLGAIVRTGVPYVGSCGALDMVNFGAMASVPERYRGRNLYVHNPQVTLMRTTPEENVRMGDMARGAAEPDAGAGALLPAGGRRLAARCAGPAVPRSQGGCGPVRDPRGEGGDECLPQADPAAGQRQRPGVRGRPRHRLSRDRKLTGTGLTIC